MTAAQCLTLCCDVLSRVAAQRPDLLCLWKLMLSVVFVLLSRAATQRPDLFCLWKLMLSVVFVLLSRAATQRPDLSCLWKLIGDCCTVLHSLHTQTFRSANVHMTKFRWMFCSYQNDSAWSNQDLAK